MRAFEVNAVDYLLKPVDKKRLRETLNRAQERIEHAEIVAEQASRVGAAIDAYEARPSRRISERIPVRHREEVVIVPVQPDRVDRRRRRAAERSRPFETSGTRSRIA